MKQIELHGKYGKDKFAIVDDKNFDYLNQYRWHVSANGYVLRGLWNFGKDAGKKERMHCVVMNSMYIDHINHNKLDNRKSNLRVVTALENGWNRKLSVNNKSGCKGVTFHKRDGKWQVSLKRNGKMFYFGYYKNYEDAVKVHNQKSKEFYGEYAFIGGKNG